MKIASLGLALTIGATFQVAPSISFASSVNVNGQCAFGNNCLDPTPIAPNTNQTVPFSYNISVNGDRYILNGTLHDQNNAITLVYDAFSLMYLGALPSSQEDTISVDTVHILDSIRNNETNTGVSAGIPLIILAVHGPNSIFSATTQVGDHTFDFGSFSNIPPFFFSAPQLTATTNFGSLVNVENDYTLKFAAGTVFGDQIDVNENLAPIPVPEPAAWALLLSGFGLVGSVLRRRQLGQRAMR